MERSSPNPIKIRLPGGSAWGGKLGAISIFNIFRMSSGGDLVWLAASVFSGNGVRVGVGWIAGIWVGSNVIEGNGVIVGSWSGYNRVPEVEQPARKKNTRILIR